jgi:hypothetical protein
MVRCPWISKLEMKGEMLLGNSAVTARMEVRFLSRVVEMDSACEEAVGMPKRDMLLASWGCGHIAFEGAIGGVVAAGVDGGARRGSLGVP